MPVHKKHKVAWELLREGDPGSLECLFKEHYLGLLNYGMKFIGRRELVKDCITQVLLDLWNRRENLPEVNNVRSYLLTTLHRRLLREVKKEKHANQEYYINSKSADLVETSYEEYLINIQSDQILRNRLFSAFNKLTARQKELLRMRFFEDKSYEEIAEFCNITKRTAYNIIYDAITELRKELTKDTRKSAYYFSSWHTVILLLQTFL